MNQQDASTPAAHELHAPNVKESGARRIHGGSDNTLAGTDVTAATPNRNVVTPCPVGDVEHYAEDDAKVSISKSKNIVEFEVKDYTYILEGVNNISVEVANCRQIRDKK